PEVNVGEGFILVTPPAGLFEVNADEEAKPGGKSEDPAKPGGKSEAGAKPEAAASAEAASGDNA
ncbi:MAG: hypothetical protein JWO34_2097, partial [Arthrobacter sp.]|nr:hypothetical protein [Arthrobacter sp.]